MRKITRDKLEERIGIDPSVVLVEVLDEDQFHRAHLPNAINVPLNADFERQIEIALPDKAMPVIVYCSDSESRTSPQAIRRMEKLGYRNVSHYPGGKTDWCDAGLPVIGYG